MLPRTLEPLFAREDRVRFEGGRSVAVLLDDITRRAKYVSYAMPELFHARVVVRMRRQYRDARGNAPPLNKSRPAAPPVGALISELDVGPPPVAPRKLLGKIRLLPRRNLPNRPVLIHVNELEPRLIAAARAEHPNEAANS